MKREQYVGFKINSFIIQDIEQLAEQDERKYLDYLRIIIMREIKKELSV